MGRQCIEAVKWDKLLWRQHQEDHTVSTSTESRENYVVLSIYKYRFCDVGTCVPAILTVVTGGLCSKCAHRRTHTTAMPTSAFFQSLHKYIHTYIHTCMYACPQLMHCCAMQLKHHGMESSTNLRTYVSMHVIVFQFK